MITSKIRSKAAIAFGVALAIILSIGFFQSIARADISNPHPTPPAGSVTNAIIAPNTILDSNISPAAAINTEKLAGGSTIGATLVSDGVGVEAVNLFTISTSTQTILDQASTTLMASTSIAASATAPEYQNNVKYVYPTTQGTSGQALTNNGSGVLSWAPQGPVIENNTNIFTAGSAGTTTGEYTNIPAGVITASSTIMVQAFYENSGSSFQCDGNIEFGDGNSTSTVAYFSSGSTQGFFANTAVGMATSSTQTQWGGQGYGGITVGKITHAQHFNAAGPNGVQVSLNYGNNGNNCSVQGLSVIVFP